MAKEVVNWIDMAQNPQQDIIDMAELIQALWEFAAAMKKS